MLSVSKNSILRATAFAMSAKLNTPLLLLNPRRSSRLANAETVAAGLDTGASIGHPKATMGRPIANQGHGEKRRVAVPVTGMQEGAAGQGISGESPKDKSGPKRSKRAAVTGEMEVALEGPPVKRKPKRTRAAETKGQGGAVGTVPVHQASDGKVRCGWSSMYTGASSAAYLKYHDEEWGVPQHDDRALFELLVLEGAQAGLSWSTILNKRERYRQVFDNFEPQKVAKYGPDKIAALLEDPGIVRNRSKVTSAVENARLVLQIQKEFGSFGTYLWSFVGTKPLTNKFASLSEIPSKTAESEALSKDLIRRGFRFVGPTIMYAFMQAVGMVNDHLIDCFRHTEVEEMHVGESKPHKSTKG